MKLGHIRAAHPLGRFRRRSSAAATEEARKQKKRPSQRCDDMKRADSQLATTFDAGRMTEAVFTSMVGLGD